jgi:hypothetical protein
MDVFDKVVPDVNPRQWPNSLVKQWKHACTLGLLVLRTSLRQGLGSLRLSGATPRQDLKINTPGGNVDHSIPFGSQGCRESTAGLTLLTIQIEFVDLSVACNVRRCKG